MAGRTNVGRLRLATVAAIGLSHVAAPLPGQTGAAPQGNPPTTAPSRPGEGPAAMPPAASPPGAPDPWLVKPPFALELSDDDLLPRFPAPTFQDLAWPSIPGFGWQAPPYGASFKLYGFVDHAASAGGRGVLGGVLGGADGSNVSPIDRSRSYPFGLWNAPPALGVNWAGDGFAGLSARGISGTSPVDLPQATTIAGDLVLPPLSIGPRGSRTWPSRIIPSLTPGAATSLEGFQAPAGFDPIASGGADRFANLAAGHLQSGDAALAEGHYREAAAAYEKAIRLGAGDAAIHLRRAQALFAVGAFDEAGADLLAGLNRLSLGKLSGLKQFRVLHDEGLVERRLQELQALLDAESDTARLALAGFVAYTCERKKTGLQFLKKARATAPNDAALSAFVFVLEQLQPPEPDPNATEPVP